MLARQIAHSGHVKERVFRMKQSARTLVIAASAGLVLASALSACSVNIGGSSQASPSMVGGMTECTQDILEKATNDLAASLGNTIASFDGLECADGWAVTSAVMGDAPQTFIFQAEGQFWVPQDKVKVCGTYDSASPDTVPADATIPSALYTSGCLTG